MISDIPLKVSPCLLLLVKVMRIHMLTPASRSVNRRVQDEGRNLVLRSQRFPIPCDSKPSMTRSGRCGSRGSQVDELGRVGTTYDG